MKKLFIAALLFVGLASFAQGNDQREKLTPEQRSEKQLTKLTTELNLDANQQAQVKQLIAEKSVKAEKLREARKAQRDSNVKPTDAEREAFKKEALAEKESTDAKMKAILNADQYKKWTSIQQENRDKARDRMKGNRDDQN